MPGTVLNILPVLTHLTITTTLDGYYYYSSFKDEMAEAREV